MEWRPANFVEPPTDENQRPRATEQDTVLAGVKCEAYWVQAFGAPCNRTFAAARSLMQAHAVCAIAAQLTICRRSFLSWSGSRSWPSRASQEPSIRYLAGKPSRAPPRQTTRRFHVHERRSVRWSTCTARRSLPWRGGGRQRRRPGQRERRPPVRAELVCRASDPQRMGGRRLATVRAWRSTWEVRTRRGMGAATALPARARVVTAQKEAPRARARARAMRLPIRTASC